MMMVVTVLMVIILVNRGMCLCGNCYGDDIGDDHENMLLNMLNMLRQYVRSCDESSPEVVQK